VATPDARFGRGASVGIHQVILPTEKKFLEQVMESSLGASRKKPLTKKTTVKKTAARPKVRPKGRT